MFRFAKKTPDEYIVEEEALAQNPNCRVPITVCLDCSYSMGREDRLKRAMEGLRRFCEDMQRDPFAQDSVELCIISYGGTEARVERDFALPGEVLENMPKLKADGETPLAEAVNGALDNLEARKRQYKKPGVGSYRPWLIIIGDGDEKGSAEELDRAAQRIREEFKNKRLNVYCVLVGDLVGDKEDTSLRRLSPTEDNYIYLEDLKFEEFFVWMSRSIGQVSRAMSGEEDRYLPQGTRPLKD